MFTSSAIPSALPLNIHQRVIAASLHDPSINLQHGLLWVTEHVRFPSFLHVRRARLLMPCHRSMTNEVYEQSSVDGENVIMRCRINRCLLSSEPLIQLL
jgi:hypothetical protein